MVERGGIDKLVETEEGEELIVVNCMESLEMDLMNESDLN